MRHGQFEDDVIVVTGGGSGIGEATARLVGHRGARVVVADVDLDAAMGTAQDIVNAGGSALGVHVDVTDASSTEELASRSVGEYGRIDGLFANAGIAGSATAEECTPELWSRVIGVNLTGVWLSVRSVLPQMRRQGGGSIVATASIAALVGVRTLAPYSAAKAGVVGLVRQVAIDYGRHGIRANALVPGTTRTPLVEASFLDSGFAEDELDDLMVRAGRPYPLGRLGDLTEVAEAAAHLLSRASSWTTATTHVVDGGLSAS